MCWQYWQTHLKWLHGKPLNMNVITDKTPKITTIALGYKLLLYDTYWYVDKRARVVFSSLYQLSKQNTEQ